jgi:hypothetical protein
MLLLTLTFLKFSKNCVFAFTYKKNNVYLIFSQVFFRRMFFNDEKLKSNYKSIRTRVLVNRLI